MDESGKPIPGIQVREGWAYFGLDLAPEIDDRVTDSDGHIAFPRRVTWASVATRATLGDPTDGVHAGPSLYIQACDSDHLKEAKLFWDGNKFWNPATHEGESQLVAKSVKECGEISMGLLELPLYTRASR